MPQCRQTRHSHYDTKHFEQDFYGYVRENYNMNIEGRTKGWWGRGRGFTLFFLTLKWRSLFFFGGGGGACRIPVAPIAPSFWRWDRLFGFFGGPFFCCLSHPLFKKLMRLLCKWVFTQLTWQCNTLCPGSGASPGTGMQYICAHE